MTNECTCKDFPHRICINASTALFKATDGTEVNIGPLQPGEEQKFEKDGHYYVVERMKAH